MANPRYNTQTTNRRGAMGGGMMRKRPGYKAGNRVRRAGAAFPDHSGDGKITQKDILMAKGVIPKTKKKK